MSRHPLIPGRNAEEKSLLAAAINEPEDDTPRLVYADWLEEHGEQDRAEFIRVQLALAQLADDSGRRAALKRREVELLQQHWTEWAEPLFALRALEWQFRRGLLDEVTLPAEDFLHGAETLFRTTTARHICLRDAAGLISDLAGCPYLTQVMRLDLSGGDEDHRTGNDPDDTAARALADSPHLAGLRGLCLSSGAVSEEGCRTLAASPHLARLTELELSGNPFGDAGATALVGGPQLANLRCLGLQECQLGPGAGLALAHSSQLARLQTLLLDWNALGDDGIRELAASHTLTDLTALSLMGDAGGDDSACALAVSPRLGQLSALLLGDEVGEVGLAAILSSPHLRHVTALGFGDAYHFRFRDFPPDNVLLPQAGRPAPGQFSLAHSNRNLPAVEVLRRANVPPGLSVLAVRAGWRPGNEVEGLANWPALAGLTHLDLSQSALGDRAADLLASPLLRGLRHLDLRRCNVTAEAAGALATSPHLSALEEVRLDGEQLVPEALRTLAASPRAALFHCDFPALLRREQWPEPWGRLLHGERLQHLSIRMETWIGDAELIKLAETPLLAGLLSLDLGQAQITLEGVRALAASPHVAGLRLLRLSFLPIGDEGARIVAASPHLASLTTLALSFCDVGDDGAMALAASPHLTRLTTLKLWGYGTNVIGDAGAAALANSPALANLVALRLRDNGIGDTGAEALAAAPYWPRLLYMYISGNPIGPRGWEALRQRFGGRVRYFVGSPLPDGL